MVIPIEACLALNVTVATCNVQASNKAEPLYKQPGHPFIASRVGYRRRKRLHEERITLVRPDQQTYGGSKALQRY